MRNIIVSISLLLMTCGWLPAGANGFSYIYIQGDKQVPFYIKFEDQMLPRYGKNYNVIPQLAPGAVNIQVLFQQNMYPAQKFTIVVPEDGFRGFLLLQKNGSFALYDIHQQFYLYPGNKAEDDRVPQANTYVYTNTPVVQQQQPPATAVTQGHMRTNNTAGNNREPRFIGNMELNSERAIYSAPPPVPVQERPEVVKDDYTTEPVVDEQSLSATNNSYNDNSEPEQAPTPTPSPGSFVTNSDCPTAMDNAMFEDLYEKTQAKQEKQKLKFLLSKMDNCYTSQQARVMAESLNNDPEKYTFLKRVFPRVTDQYNFAALENLLSTQEWKGYFRLILPK